MEIKLLLFQVFFIKFFKIETIFFCKAFTIIP